MKRLSFVLIVLALTAVQRVHAQYYSVNYDARTVAAMATAFGTEAVAEGYYLGTTSGHKYFGAGEGFAVGDKLHAVVIDDGDFPEAAHPLNVEERFERAIYMTHRHNIVSVWSDGREVVRR